ncbi:arylsulfotransferase family protein [Halobaculum sp. MBLA0147]|uniref:arylsulfotransferase family protein n=1 Tax=Halobaculum sp. MBLA0147 TaxID=3079934 RepID=UPI0035260186
MRRRALRGVFALVVLLSVVQLSVAATTSPTVKDRYENAGTQAVAPTANGTTVITTSPRKGTDASLIALGPDGRVEYYEERYRQYFDVDPVGNTSSTVEFVAKDTSVTCPTGTEPCADAVFVRVNISTGEREVFERFQAQLRADWHDFDRIDEQTVLIADINNEIRIYNTRRDVTTWAYNFRADFKREDGGSFPKDWTHLNDVEWLGNGTIIASPRNLDQVVFIHKQRGLLESRTLGSDGNYSRLFEQHNPDFIPAERGGPAVVVADSENNRVVEYERRDDGWVRTWSWSDARMSWPRDADRLPNGHTLVTDSNGGRILELNRDGEIVWSVPVDTPYEAERLGTGDESSGGMAASRAGLAGTNSRVVDESSDADSSSAPLASRVVIAIKSFLPSLVVNGLLFVLPGWMGSIELLVLALLSGILSLWAGTEAYWRGYRFRSPISRT